MPTNKLIHCINFIFVISSFSPFTTKVQKIFDSDWMKQIEQEDNDFRDLINSSLLPHRGPKGIQRQLDQAADFKAAR